MKRFLLLFLVFLSAVCLVYPQPAVRSAMRVFHWYGQQDSFVSTEFSRVPFELVGGMMLVYAEVNGRKGQFILDTGSPTLILNGETKTEGTERMLTVSEECNAHQRWVGEFKWANIRMTGLEALVMDMGHLEDNYERELMGVIGYELFAGRQLMVDTRQNQIWIGGKEVRSWIDFATPLEAIPFTLEAHLPIVQLEVGDTVFHFGFDSGASVNLMDEGLLGSLREQDYQLIREKELYGFFSKPQAVPLIRTSAVHIPQLGRQEMEFLLVDFSRLHRNELLLDGLLGYPFVKGKVYSVDYSRRLITFWDTEGGLIGQIP